MDKIVTPCDPNALPCVRELMRYLGGLSGSGILTGQPKIALIGEIGTIPSAEALAEERSQWVSYMTWCNDFCLTEKFTDDAALRAMYHHPWAVTLDRLPRLY